MCSMTDDNAADHSKVGHHSVAEQQLQQQPDGGMMADVWDLRDTGARGQCHCVPSKSAKLSRLNPVSTSAHHRIGPAVLSKGERKEMSDSFGGSSSGGSYRFATSGAQGRRLTSLSRGHFHRRSCKMDQNHHRLSPTIFRSTISPVTSSSSSSTAPRSDSQRPHSTIFPLTCDDNSSSQRVYARSNVPPGCLLQSSTDGATSSLPLVDVKYSPSVRAVTTNPHLPGNGNILSSTGTNPPHVPSSANATVVREDGQPCGTTESMLPRPAGTDDPLSQSELLQDKVSGSPCSQKPPVDSILLPGADVKPSADFSATGTLTHSGSTSSIDNLATTNVSPPTPVVAEPVTPPPLHNDPLHATAANDVANALTANGSFDGTQNFSSALALEPMSSPEEDCSSAPDQDKNFAANFDPVVKPGRTGVEFTGVLLSRPSLSRHAEEMESLEANRPEKSSSCASADSLCPQQPSDALNTPFQSITTTSGGTASYTSSLELLAASVPPSCSSFSGDDTKYDHSSLVESSSSFLAGQVAGTGGGSYSCNSAAVATPPLLQRQENNNLNPSFSSSSGGGGSVLMPNGFEHKVGGAGGLSNSGSSSSLHLLNPNRHLHPSQELPDVFMENEFPSSHISSPEDIATTPSVLLSPPQSTESEKLDGEQHSTTTGGGGTVVSCKHNQQLASSSNTLYSSAAGGVPGMTTSFPPTSTSTAMLLAQVSINTLSDANNTDKISYWDTSADASYGVGGKVVVNAPSSIPATSANTSCGGHDYSYIYPTPPEPDAKDVVPACVFEVPSVAFYDTMTAREFAVASLPSTSWLAGDRRRPFQHATWSSDVHFSHSMLRMPSFAPSAQPPNIQSSSGFQSATDEQQEQRYQVVDSMRVPNDPMALSGQQQPGGGLPVHMTTSPGNRIMMNVPIPPPPGNVVSANQHPAAHHASPLGPPQTTMQDILRRHTQTLAGSTIDGLGGGGLESIDSSSPAYVSQMRTPKTVESLRSPLSNNSPYMIRNQSSSVEPVLSSVGAAATGAVIEGHSLAFVLLMADTFVNHHTDVSYDSCPLCACNMDLIGWEQGLYAALDDRQGGSNCRGSGAVMNAESSAANPIRPLLECRCGFSAVRSRYLGVRSGIFFEDELEVTGLWRYRQQQEQQGQLLFNGEDARHEESIGGTSSSQSSVGDGGNRRHQPMIDLIRAECAATLIDDYGFQYYNENGNWGTTSMTGRSRTSLQHSAWGGSGNHERPTDVMQKQGHPGPKWKIRPPFLELALSDFALSCEQSMQQAISMASDGQMPAATLKKLSLFSSRNRGKLLGTLDWSLSRCCWLEPGVETLGLLKNLLPCLQESLQKARGLWEAKHKVDGPLTWRFFCRHCNAGREDECEPEPVPMIAVKSEDDVVSVAPQALRFWDRVITEPFASSRDVMYVVVTPDNHKGNIVAAVRRFFKELSDAYEAGRLGRHMPETKILNDGIMRINNTHLKKLENHAVDDWFDSSDVRTQNRLCDRLKIYAKACRYVLAPHVSSLQPWDPHFCRSNDLGVPGSSSSTTATPAGCPIAANSPAGMNCGPGLVGVHPPSDNRGTIDGGETGGPVSSSSSASVSLNGDVNSGAGGYSSISGASSSCGTSGISDCSDNPNVPVIVIYLVNPWEDEAPASTVGLYRCYMEMLLELPATVRPYIQVQIVPLEMIVRPQSQEELRGLTLSIYSKVRSMSLDRFQIKAKTLTCFGPRTAINLLAEGKKKPDMPLHSMGTPLSVLWHGNPVDSAGGSVCSFREEQDVLYVAYCLSDAQEWLMGTFTDQNGQLSDSTLINLKVPNRAICKKGAMVVQALWQLWDYIMYMVSQSGRPWRIVIGRLGRLGREEMKVWSSLLNKKHLRQCSRNLHKECDQCKELPIGSENPSILSACLISIEPEPHVRSIPLVLQGDGGSGASSVAKGGSSASNPFGPSPLDDHSITHILVFPTSATAQMMSHQGAGAAASPSGLGELEDILFPQDCDLETDEQIKALMDIDCGMNGEPAGGNQGALESWQNAQDSFQSVDTDDSIQNQPLALGYFISSAPTGRLPDWFWSSCPSLSQSRPVHLRFALHIFTNRVETEQTDEILVSSSSHPFASSAPQQQHRPPHPLDSNRTTDVLRWVLQTYNSLSWLNVDLGSGERRSCLPVHLQSLMRIYHAVQDLR